MPTTRSRLRHLFFKWLHSKWLWVKLPSQSKSVIVTPRIMIVWPHCIEHSGEVSALLPWLWRQRGFLWLLTGVLSRVWEGAWGKFWLLIHGECAGSFKKEWISIQTMRENVSTFTVRLVPSGTETGYDILYLVRFTTCRFHGDQRLVAGRCDYPELIIETLCFLLKNLARVCIRFDHIKILCTKVLSCGFVT